MIPVWTHLDTPDFEAGSATGIGKSGMHDATAGLFAVGSASRLDLAGLDGKGGMRIEGAGRTETRRDCDEHKQAGKVYKNIYTYAI